MHEWKYRGFKIIIYMYDNGKFLLWNKKNI